MRLGRRLFGVAIGLGLGLVALGMGALDGAHARTAPSGDRLRVNSVNVDGLSGVALNQVIEIRFNARVTGSSLTNGSIAIVPLDVATGVLGDARPGVLTRRGNVVRFTPTLPTHARDPDDPDGDFFAPDTARDDAFENGSFRPASDYRIVVAGQTEKRPARSALRLPPRRSETFDFRTAARATSDRLFLLEEYARTPPDIIFSSPSDRTPLTADRYTQVGGTPGVATAADVTVFFLSGVPLDPAVARAPGVVELTRVARAGTDEPPTPVAGDALLEQDRNRTFLVFRPSQPLAADSTFALRIGASLRDLTGLYRIVDDPKRLRLRAIYDFLAGQRSLSPELDPGLLRDPLAFLIFDWPLDPEERSILKRNVLELGDTRPWEIDPRVFAIFTTGQGAGGPPSGAVASTGGARRRRSLARVVRIVTPLGLQGVSGAGWNVIIPFTLSQTRGRSALVEAQFGIDRNADGRIEEDEFSPATLDSRDGRARGETRRSATKRRGARREFLAAPTSGRSNSLAWNSLADLDRGSYSRLRVLHTPQGRVIEDPDRPGEPMTVPGRGEIVFRIRAVRGRRRASKWMQTAPFDWTTIDAPSLTIDGVTPGTPTFVAWSAFDPDGEDWNGNGVLDLLDLEDRNGNGVLDATPVAVAFDYHVLESGERPESLSEEELAALDWRPCTRATDFGDPDDGVASSPRGLVHTFAWAAVGDALSAGTQVILRGRPFDATETHGPWVYRREPVTLRD